LQHITVDPLKTSKANLSNTIPNEKASDTKPIPDTEKTIQEDDRSAILCELPDDKCDVDDINNMNDGSNTDDEGAVYDPTSSDITKRDELPDDTYTAILSTTPEKSNNVGDADDTKIGPTNEGKLYATSCDKHRNSTQWQGMTANVEGSHNMSRNSKGPSDTMGDTINGKDSVAMDVRMADVHTSDRKSAGIQDEISADTIGMELVFTGLSVGVGVQVADGALRRYWDLDGKSTVLSWITGSGPAFRVPSRACSTPKLLEGVGCYVALLPSGLKG
jgi:hypothetical protein